MEQLDTFDYPMEISLKDPDEVLDFSFSCEKPRGMKIRYALPVFDNTRALTVSQEQRKKDHEKSWRKGQQKRKHQVCHSGKSCEAVRLANMTSAHELMKGAWEGLARLWREVYLGEPQLVAQAPGPAQVPDVPAIAPTAPAQMDEDAEPAQVPEVPPIAPVVPAQVAADAEAQAPEVPAIAPVVPAQVGEDAQPARVPEVPAIAPVSASSTMLPATSASASAGSATSPVDDAAGAAAPAVEPGSQTPAATETPSSPTPGAGDPAWRRFGLASDEAEWAVRAQEAPRTPDVPAGFVLVPQEWGGRQLRPENAIDDAGTSQRHPKNDGENDPGSDSDTDSTASTNSSDFIPEWLEPCDDAARQPVYIVTVAAYLHAGAVPGELQDPTQLDPTKLVDMLIDAAANPARDDKKGGRKRTSEPKLAKAIAAQRAGYIQAAVKFVDKESFVPIKTALRERSRVETHWASSTSWWHKAVDRVTSEEAAPVVGDLKLWSADGKMLHLYKELLPPNNYKELKRDRETAVVAQRAKKAKKGDTKFDKLAFTHLVLAEGLRDKASVLDYPAAPVTERRLPMSVSTVSLGVPISVPGFCSRLSFPDFRSRFLTPSSGGAPSSIQIRKNTSFE